MTDQDPVGRRRLLSWRVRDWIANSPAWTLFWTVAFALMGVGCLWVGFEPTTSDRIGLLAMGAILLGLAWVNVLRMSGEHLGMQQLVAGELNGQPAAVIKMSSVGPIAMLVFSGALGALFVGIGLDGDPGGRWFFVVIGGGFLVLAAEGARALFRRARLAFTADVVDYRGWDYEARLPWSDVIGADPIWEKRREFVRVFGRSSDHYVYRKVWRLAPMELRPNPPHINTASQALRPSEPYAHLLQRCAVSTREERAELIRSLSGPTSGSLREQLPDA